MMNKLIRFILSIAASFSVAAIGSLATFQALTSWYAGLRKPFFTPPNWTFGLVWTILYILMGVSLYLVWTATYKKSKRLAVMVFGLQLALNALWSVVFFGLHAPFASIIVILTLLITNLITLWLFWPISRSAAYLLVPYILWLGFAAALNIAIFNLNSSSLQVTSYSECEKSAGSVILDSYPSVCMTVDKQSFTNPDEKIVPPTENVLYVREWGISLLLTSNITDAYYTYDGARDTIFLTTKELEASLAAIHGCTAGLHGLDYKRMDNELIEQPRIEPRCAIFVNDNTKKIAEVKDELRAAARSITAY